MGATSVVGRSASEGACVCPPLGRVTAWTWSSCVSSSFAASFCSVSRFTCQRDVNPRNSPLPSGEGFSSCDLAARRGRFGSLCCVQNWPRLGKQAATRCLCTPAGRGSPREQGHLLPGPVLFVQVTRPICCAFLCETLTVGNQGGVFFTGSKRVALAQRGVLDVPACPPGGTRNFDIKWRLMPWSAGREKYMATLPGLLFPRPHWAAREEQPPLHTAQLLSVFAS